MSALECDGIYIAHLMSIDYEAHLREQGKITEADKEKEDRENYPYKFNDK